MTDSSSKVRVVVGEGPHATEHWVEPGRELVIGDNGAVLDRIAGDPRSLACTMEDVLIGLLQAKSRKLMAEARAIEADLPPESPRARPAETASAQPEATPTSTMASPVVQPPEDGTPITAEFAVRLASSVLCDLEDARCCGSRTDRNRHLLRLAWETGIALPVVTDEFGVQYTPPYKPSRSRPRGARVNRDEPVAPAIAGDAPSAAPAARNPGEADA